MMCCGKENLMATDKNMTGLYHGTPHSVSHGQGKLANEGYPNLNSARSSTGQGMNAGKGSGSMPDKEANPSSGTSIEYNPSVKPSTSQGMSGASAKGLKEPFGHCDTKR
jgi:hypothetical protein